MTKKLMIGLTLIMLLTCLVIPAVHAGGTVVTDKDKDGFILYSETSSDAKMLLLMGDTDPSITITKEGNTVIYNINDHVLGCGTHLVGSIKETKKDGKIAVVADFAITHNPFKITKLSLNFVNDLSTKTLTGTINVDDKEMDVNLVR